MARLAVSLCSGGRFGLKEEELRQVGARCRPVATIKVPLQVLAQLAGLDTLVSIRRRIQASCSTAFLCPLHPAHRDILAVILQGGSCSCCVTMLTVLTAASSDVYATRKAASLFPVVLAAQSCANTLAAATHRAPAQLLHMLSSALTGAVEAEVFY